MTHREGAKAATEKRPLLEANRSALGRRRPALRAPRLTDAIYSPQARRYTCPGKGQVQGRYNTNAAAEVIEEEAQSRGKYHMPTIQLLRYTEGEAAGGWTLRFCSYGLTGRFSRSPLLLSHEDVEPLRDAIRKTPRLRELLRRLVE